jgi:uncharacterized protein (DUF1778 family)
MKMTKTVTLRLDDEIYRLLKKAAKGEMRSLANFLEFAAIKHLTDESFVSDTEMEEILLDKLLLKNLEDGKKDIDEGNYKIV